MTLFVWLITAYTYLLLPNITKAEIRTYNDVFLPTSSTFVSYTSGYIKAPGSVDIRKLRFESSDSYCLHNEEKCGGERRRMLVARGRRLLRGLGVLRSVTLASAHDEDEEQDTFINMTDWMDFESNPIDNAMPGPVIIDEDGMGSPSASPSEEVALIITSPQDDEKHEKKKNEDEDEKIEDILDESNDDGVTEGEIEDILDGSSSSSSSSSSSATSSFSSASPTAVPESETSSQDGDSDGDESLELSAPSITTSSTDLPSSSATASQDSEGDVDASINSSSPSAASSSSVSASLDSEGGSGNNAEGEDNSEAEDEDDALSPSLSPVVGKKKKHKHDHGDKHDTPAPSIGEDSGMDTDDMEDVDDFTNRHDDKDNDPAPAEGAGSNHTHGLPAATSAVELLLFAEPNDCANTRDGCDWTELGVGAKNEVESRWCCNEDAIDLGLCAKANSGKIIVAHKKFTGSYAMVRVPDKGVGKAGRSDGLMKTEISGHHVLIIANCGLGEDVIVRGESIWTSVHGYLPGDLWQEFEFISVLTFLYAIILCWYGYKMHVYSDYAIPIQKWLLVTLLTGFIEVLFKAGDYWIWNEDGIRFEPVMYVGIFAGVLKRSISRGLILMVCLGWGVVRDTLGGKMRKIILFIIAYTVVSSLRDVFTSFAVTDPDLTTDEEHKVVDLVAIFTFATATLDVIIYLWILDSLNATIDHLETMSQHQKLKIMLRLRLILILSILFAVFWSIFGIVNLYLDERILDLESAWAVNGAWEVNYLFVLVCIALLWKPNERAKELAYAMELPSSGDLDEVEFDTNLGLHEDEDWNDDGIANEFSLDDEDGDNGFAMGEYGNGLRIEDGEHA